MKVLKKVINRKFIVQMTRTGLLCTFMFMLALNCMAVNSYSQTVRLSMNIDKPNLYDAIVEIKNQTEFDFLYSKDIEPLYQANAQIVVENGTIEEVLNQLFKSSRIEYQIVDKTIVLMPGKDVAENSNVAPQVRQGISVSGTVSDHEGSVPGVNVTVKGTSIGVVTDMNGKYTITVPSEEAVLAFSFVGYDTQEMTVGNQREINVELSVDTQQIEEVIVIGYGTTTRETLTGAVSTISAAELDSRPVANAAQALQGLIPGLNVDVMSGNMTTRPSFNVRGPGIIGGSTSFSLGEPLVIIDGLEGDLLNVNPNDIENISVLKDAAASSIYGAKAAFGVIIVTTKRGKAGNKATVNYSYNLRLASLIRVPEMMDSYSFMAMQNDAMQSDGKGARYSDEIMQKALQFQRGEITSNNTPRLDNPLYWQEGYESGYDNVDYFKVLFRDVSTDQEHNISTSGGVGNLTYFASFNYLQRLGFLNFQRDATNRKTTNVRLSYDLNPWMKINYNNRFINNEIRMPEYLGNWSDNGWFYEMARQSWPNFPLYDPYGNLWSWHALFLRDGGTAWDITDQLLQNLQFVFEPVKNWKTYVQYGYTITNRHRKNVNNGTFYHHDTNGVPYAYTTSGTSAGFVNERENKAQLQDFNAYSEYSFSLQKSHNFKVMAGMQTQKAFLRYVRVQRGGLQTQSLPVIDLTTGFPSLQATSTTPPTIEGNEDHYSTMGFFGRINYDFQNKYLFEANFRYDGTSRFREGSRWTLSPSAALAWNIAREDFMQPLEQIITQLKLRVSYGVLSNQNTRSYYPTYQDMALSSLNSEWTFEGGRQVDMARAPTTLYNPYLTWETIKTSNIGLDFGFLRNRLTGSLEIFRRENENMLGPAETRPVVLGASVPRENNTSLKDTGFELTLGWRDRLQSGLSYGIRFNVQDSKTIITKYPNPTGSISRGITNQYNAGHQTNEIWGYTTLGIAKSQEEMDAHIASLPNNGQNSVSPVAWRVGDIMYKDINNLGGINQGALTLNDHGNLSVIGNATPRYRFGLDMNAAWKGFDLRIFFQGTLKRDYWMNNSHFWGAAEGDWNVTAYKPHTNYFRADPNHPLGQNLNGYYPRPYNSNNRNRECQTRYLQDASYVRLKNLQVGYTLPANLTNKIMVEKIRVYFSGENLFTFTNLASMFDPEGIGGSDRGMAFPLSRVISFGVNINF